MSIKEEQLEHLIDLTQDFISCLETLLKNGDITESKYNELTSKKLEFLNYVKKDRIVL